jgi:hypothetical protein
VTPRNLSNRLSGERERDPELELHEQQSIQLEKKQLFLPSQGPRIHESEKDKLSNIAVKREIRKGSRGKSFGRKISS